MLNEHRPYVYGNVSMFIGYFFQRVSPKHAICYFSEGLWGEVIGFGMPRPCDRTCHKHALWRGHSEAKSSPYGSSALTIQSNAL